ncbi:hypothetical protein PHMEG_00032547 [Phytophthora megakarya]|uniref:Uncharacterized protein n=1 Tax=Phytophthora megakarya TaxID=4795 RepID=A0A225UV86_9STRA|nr:hypothetical protein PHMEG_00032547 [Phytophthora megakarya]
MADLQLAHDQLGELRVLAKSDLNEADVLLTHLASRIRESQAARIPKREQSSPSSPPQLPPLKAPCSDRPTSPPPDQDQPEIEGLEHEDFEDQPEIEGPEHEEIEDQPEIEGPEGEGTEDKPEISSGGGGGSDDGDSSPSDHGPSTPPPTPPGSPGGSSGGGSPGGGSPLQLNPPLFPAEASIPLSSTVKIFTAAEITPWDPAIVGTVPILVMIPATLTKRLPPGFLFPVRTPFVPAPIPVTGYRSELITGANNRPTPLTFDHNLHRRAATPLWRIAVSYAALEEDHLIAYWKSTHYLEITKAMATADHDLLVYHQDQRQRRIRAGESWRRLLGECVLMMRAQWADIDVLLDPPAGFPGLGTLPTANLPEPTDLITALFEGDQADPWRNHYRDPGPAHPSLQIPRLVVKFNPPAAP